MIVVITGYLNFLPGAPVCLCVCLLCLFVCWIVVFLSHFAILYDPWGTNACTHPYTLACPNAVVRDGVQVDISSVLCSFFPLPLSLSPFSHLLRTRAPPAHATENSANLNFIRIFRLLRPLRTISSVHGMRIMVNSIFKSFQNMGSVLILVSFMFALFGIIGMQVGRIQVRAWKVEGRRSFVHDTQL